MLQPLLLMLRYYDDAIITPLLCAYCRAVDIRYIA